MTLFDLPAAKVFASNLNKGREHSPMDIVSRLRKKSTIIVQEGSREFEEARSALLWHAEWGLLLAASNARRSYELMRPVAAPWAHVTLYYAAWYASSAILALLGGFIGIGGWIGVKSSKAGAMALEISRKRLSTDSGSHGTFWREFFEQMASFEPWIAPPHKQAAEPANGDPLWMITERNLVNYRHAVAARAMTVFLGGFDGARFPDCLSGPLATQYQSTVSILGMAYWLASEVGLHTDALSELEPGLSRQEAIRRYVMGASNVTVDESVIARVFPV